jgi:hypothetical protein
MWWCGGIAGDYILYAEADSLGGPWHGHTSSVKNSFDIVFQPTREERAFDGLHVCDPSVIRVRGKYYMYYSGAQPGGGYTRIGVAQSDDGFHWTRLNGGRPIIVPRAELEGRAYANEYGAGQPSVCYVDGFFYLVYTDVTGLGPSGVYVKRARNPDFSDAEDMVREHDGVVRFVPSSLETYAVHRLYHGLSVDWQFSDVYRAFLVAGSFTDGQINVNIFDESLSHQLGDVTIPAKWNDGPGIVSRPDKHALASSTRGRIPFDIIRAVDIRPEPHDWNPYYWQLAHVGVDLQSSEEALRAGSEQAP